MLRPAVIQSNCLLLAGAMLAGCSPVSVDESPASNELVLKSAPTTSEQPEPNLEVEPNDDYAGAQPVFVGRPAELIGTINPGTTILDRDLWNIGRINRGDRIIARISLEQPGNVMVGILNDRGELFAHADATNAVDFIRTLDVVVRGDSPQTYVVVTTRTGNNLAVTYHVELSVQRDDGVPALRPQAVVLHFSGGTQVKVSSRSAVDIPAFDAAVISESFRGKTQEIIESVHALVIEQYGQLGVSIYRDGDPAIPAESVSHVYFGSYDPGLLGLADNVDPFNNRLEQTAIIYTDTFAIFNSLRPTVRQIAQVLANVTSHEIGHLLGLRHTADPADIMDVTASASQMLQQQWFGSVALHSSVLCMGYQNAPDLLEQTVGGWLPPPPAAKILARQRAILAIDPAEDFHIPREHLMNCSGGE